MKNLEARGTIGDAYHTDVPVLLQGCKGIAQCEPCRPVRRTC